MAVDIRGRICLLKIDLLFREFMEGLSTTPEFREKEGGSMRIVKRLKTMKTWQFFYVLFCFLCMLVGICTLTIHAAGVYASRLWIDTRR